jgi:hypothetical protein
MSTVPYIFAGDTGNIPLSQLDVNFANVKASVDYVIANAQANITSVGTLTALSVSGNVTVGNVLTSGIVSATGNITGNYFVGNGSQLTGIAASYGNANVATFLAEYGSNTVSTTGNITSGNILTSGLISATGNVQAGNIRTAGLISATGNVTGGNLNVTGNIVDTGALSIITGSNGNIALAPNGTGIVTVASAVSATGNITGNNINSTTSFRLPVYANTTVRDSTISSPVAGMMIFVTGTGMQVRGVTQWNTVTGSGT